MKNFKTLEVGKTYKNRKGELVIITQTRKYSTDYPFYGSNCRTYTQCGLIFKGGYYTNNDDLIELIEDMPTLAPNGQDAKPLTICEIDAKIAELQELRKELDKNIEVSDNSWGDTIGVRTFGKYEEKGFRLSSRYNWEIVNDCGDLVLVPTKK